MAERREVEVSPGQVEKLDENAEAILDGVGLTLVSYFQKAFEGQAWGGTPWASRYPFQRAPHINVAGALADFISGSVSPKRRRFDNRPALSDTGALQSSLTFSTRGGDTVVAGTTLPYADLMNEGGTSEQAVPLAAKHRINKWIQKRPEYAQHLGKILNEDVHTTEVVGRKFVGMNPELLALIADGVGDVIEHIKE